MFTDIDYDDPEHFVKQCRLDLERYPRQPLPEPRRIVSRDFVMGNADYDYEPDRDVWQDNLPAFVRKQAA